MGYDLCSTSGRRASGLLWGSWGLEDRRGPELPWGASLFGFPFVVFLIFFFWFRSPLHLVQQSSVLLCFRLCTTLRSFTVRVQCWNSQIECTLRPNLGASFINYIQLNHGVYLHLRTIISCTRPAVFTLTGMELRHFHSVETFLQSPLAHSRSIARASRSSGASFLSKCHF